jgi:hypothetical protein
MRTSPPPRIQNEKFKIKKEEGSVAEKHGSGDGCEAGGETAAEKIGDGSWEIGVGR